MSAPVVAIISPGAMGAGIASRLTSNGIRVLSTYSDRSEATQKRAKLAGMVEAPLSQILQESDWLLSILPPKDAEDFAQKTLDEAAKLENQRRVPVFVDCNAKNTDTTVRIAQLFASGPFTFLNACIIGLPPEGTHDPAIYASAASDTHNQQVLSDFGQFNKYGLCVKTIAGEGADLCDASALKMTFSVGITMTGLARLVRKGIMKGMVGVYETMMLAAYNYSPSVSEALLKEMQRSLPFDLKFIDKYIPQSFGKAYRFVREMEEMCGFVHDNVDSTGESSDEGVDIIYSGLGSLFERVAGSDEGKGRVFSDGLTDIQAMQKFVKTAKQVNSIVDS